MWAREVAGRLPDGRLAEVPGGHAVHHSAPAELSRIVRALLPVSGA